MSELAVSGIGKSFGSRVALRDVSFVLEPGGVVGLVGANGAGKTTLLGILGGTVPADAGTLTGFGAGGRVGWVPQTPALYGRLSVEENLRLFARLERVADVDGVVARMLEQTGLAGRAGEPVAKLSGGNRQRVNVAIGLLAEPSVLLLDEPSASLDPAQRERLWEFISGLAGAGTAVLFSTHDVGEVARFADRVLVLASGRLRASGTPADLAAGSPDLEAALLGLLRESGPEA